MNFDIAATNDLVKAIVVNINFTTIIVIPDLDAEGIGTTWVTIFGPNHELKEVTCGSCATINGA